MICLYSTIINLLVIGAFLLYGLFQAVPNIETDSNCKGFCHWIEIQSLNSIKLAANWVDDFKLKPNVEYVPTHCLATQ